MCLTKIKSLSSTSSDKSKGFVVMSESQYGEKVSKLLGGGEERRRIMKE